MHVLCGHELSSPACTAAFVCASQRITNEDANVVQAEGDETLVDLCLEYTKFNPDMGRTAFHVGFFNTKFPAFPYVPCTPSRPMQPIISLPCEYNNTFPIAETREHN